MDHVEKRKQCLAALSGHYKEVGTLVSVQAYGASFVTFYPALVLSLEPVQVDLYYVIPYVLREYSLSDLLVFVDSVKDVEKIKEELCYLASVGLVYEHNSLYYKSVPEGTDLIQGAVNLQSKERDFKWAIFGHVDALRPRKSFSRSYYTSGYHKFAYYPFPIAQALLNAKAFTAESSQSLIAPDKFYQDFLTFLEGREQNAIYVFRRFSGVSDTAATCFYWGQLTHFERLALSIDVDCLNIQAPLVSEVVLRYVRNRAEEGSKTFAIEFHGGKCYSCDSLAEYASIHERWCALCVPKGLNRHVLLTYPVEIRSNEYGIQIDLGISRFLPFDPRKKDFNLFELHDPFRPRFHLDKLAEEELYDMKSWFSIYYSGVIFPEYQELFVTRYTKYTVAGHLFINSFLDRFYLPLLINTAAMKEYPGESLEDLKFFRSQLPHFYDNKISKKAFEAFKNAYNLLEARIGFYNLVIKPLNFKAAPPVTGRKHYRSKLKK